MNPALTKAKKTLIKKQPLESFSQYSVFDGWKNDQNINARVSFDCHTEEFELVVFHFEIKCCHQCF